jgi:hypothetical protein
VFVSALTWSIIQRLSQPDESSRLPTGFATHLRPKKISKGQPKRPLTDVVLLMPLIEPIAHARSRLIS